MTTQVNIFEQASRLDIRYETTRGMVSIGDLWKAPLVSNDGYSLDRIAISLHEDLEATKISFVNTEPKTPGKGRERTQLKFDIVKHIIDTRLEERKIAEAAQAKAAQKAKLLELIEQKQEEAVGAKSVEELKAMLEAL